MGANIRYRCTVISALRYCSGKNLRDLFLHALITPLLLITSPAYASIEEHPDAELRAALIKAVNESNSFEDRFVAEVWLTDMSARLKKRIKEHKNRLEMLKAIHYESKRAELPPELVLAVIEIESNFNRFAISRVGARGLMQIMPFWLKEIGRPDDNLFKVQTNLRFGCTILKHYLDKEKGNLRQALARYNGSVGKRKYPDKVFNALSTRWYRQ